MDYLQDQLTTLLANGSVSPSTVKTIYTYTSTAYTYARTLSTWTTTYISALLPFLPTTLPSTSGDLLSLTLLAVALFTLFKIADYLRRMIMFWVFLFIKLVAVLVLLQLAIYVYTYGVEKTLRDLGWLWGFVESLAENTAQQGGKEWAGVRGKSQARQRARPTRARWT
jgi:hypothetical protein